MPVLVGFVPTPEGRAALRRAVLECHLRGTSLIVVNSEQGSVDPTSDPSTAEVSSICIDLGVNEPEVEVRQFRNGYEPADDVLDVAEETQAELIVIGLRRRTAVGKLILGGSAQRILLDASCPVLAVKADQPSTPLGSALISGSFTITAPAQASQTAQPAQSAQTAQVAEPVESAQRVESAERVQSAQPVQSAQETV
jgi:nucleotide-binding universal stress UspA family protein